MKIAFLGSGAFGLPTLERLHRDHDLCAIVTQPDRPAGRKRVPTQTPVGLWAHTHAPSMPIFKPEDINLPQTRDPLRALDADAWVIIAFGQKLAPELIDDIFAINLHASLLPRWRGAAPIHRAVEAGDERTGNSVITIAQRMDAGAVLAQSSRPIEPHLTSGELHDLLADDGPDLICAVLQDHADGAVRFESQDETRVTRARKLSKQEGTLDFRLDAKACRAKIHAFNPWPSVTVRLYGDPFKLHRARDVPEKTDQPPGTIVNASEGLVACADHTMLQLLEVQPANKSAMSWTSFANGHEISDGTRLEEWSG